MAERQASGTQGQAGGSGGGAAGSFAVVTLAIGSGLAAWVGISGAGMPIPIAMTLSLLGAATLGFIGGFVAAIHRGEWPRFETSWGGLGGGLGGWRISPALACLIGAMVFGALFAASSVIAVAP